MGGRKGEQVHAEIYTETGGKASGGECDGAHSRALRWRERNQCRHESGEVGMAEEIGVVE